jgi:hypothetical protein
MSPAVSAAPHFLAKSLSSRLLLSPGLAALSTEKAAIPQAHSSRLEDRIQQHSRKGSAPQDKDPNIFLLIEW